MCSALTCLHLRAHLGGPGLSSCPCCQGMRVVEVAGSVFVRLLPSGHRGSRPSHPPTHPLPPLRRSQSQSASQASHRATSQPWSHICPLPDHDFIYADDKYKDSDNGKYKKIKTNTKKTTNLRLWVFPKKETASCNIMALQRDGELSMR